MTSDTIMSAVPSSPASAACRAVIGDPDRLQQIGWNLMLNAVQFTRRGGMVSVDLTRSGSQAVIEMRNSGEGIDAAFLPYVFEPFRPEDGSKARVHKGLVPGFSIVKHLVEGHGGTVTAESEGKGTGRSAPM